MNKVESNMSTMHEDFQDLFNIYLNSCVRVGLDTECTAALLKEQSMTEILNLFCRLTVDEMKTIISEEGAKFFYIYIINNYKADTPGSNNMADLILKRIPENPTLEEIDYEVVLDRIKTDMTLVALKIMELSLANY